jgi:hypothetical protein
MGDDVFPDRDMDHRDKIAWIVEENGWAAEPVAPVEGPDPRPGYTYTIGFESHFGRPEVAIFGLQGVAARGLLGMIADQHGGGVELPVGGVFIGLLEGDLPCALLTVDVARYGALFPDAASFHGDDGFRMLQFVWPDRSGRLPWDDGYDERLRLAQPVIGTWD